MVSNVHNPGQKLKMKNFTGAQKWQIVHIHEYNYIFVLYSCSVSEISAKPHVIIKIFVQHFRISYRLLCFFMMVLALVILLYDPRLQLTCHCNCYISSLCTIKYFDTISERHVHDIAIGIIGADVHKMHWCQHGNVLALFHFVSHCVD